MNKEQEIVNQFSGKIVDIIEGRDTGVEEPLSAMEAGYGTYGSLDRLLREHKRKRGEDIELFIQAIGQVLEQPNISPYTKAALLSYMGLGISDEFSTIESSVDKLASMPEADHPVLSERLDMYMEGRELTLELNNMLATSPKQEAMATEEDYQLSEFQKKYRPGLSRKVVEGCIVDEEEVASGYKIYHFYEPGRPPDPEYNLLSITAYLDGATADREMDISWRSSITSHEFIELANKFLK